MEELKNALDLVQSSRLFLRNRREYSTVAELEGEKKALRRREDVCISLFLEAFPDLEITRKAG